MSDQLRVEDVKLLTLARGARGRIAAPQGAAVRDEMGRTYSAATVDNGTVSISALDLAVAQAISAGARGAEAAVVVGAEGIEINGFRSLAGSGVPVFVCTASGDVTDTVLT
ncbi:MAG: cytidine deaminase [Candidatus Nanopelagicales bacterium]